MRSFVFGLLCGALVAAFTTAIALELVFEQQQQAARAATVSPAAAAVESRATGVDAELAQRLEGASDRALAEALDGAEFDRSWPRVGAVGRALKARADRPPKTDLLGGLADASLLGPKAKPVPILALEHEIARRRVVLDLRTHDNPATRLLDHAGEEEAVHKLIEMFTAEARPAEYEPVRADAALVLALGATDKGREVLARAIQEGPQTKRALAANALGLSDDARAFAVLADLVGHDVDPQIRIEAARGLAASSAVARGTEDLVALLGKAARSDTDEGVRVEAVKALGEVDLARSTTASATLTDLLASPSEPATVRLAAIESVRAYRKKAVSAPPDLVKALVDTLSSEHDGPVRLKLAEAVGDLAPPSFVEALQAALGGVQDPQIREALGNAIARVKARGEPP